MKMLPKLISFLFVSDVSESCEHIEIASLMSKVSVWNFFSLSKISQEEKWTMKSKGFRSVERNNSRIELISLKTITKQTADNL